MESYLYIDAEKLWDCFGYYVYVAAFFPLDV